MAELSPVLFLTSFLLQRNKSLLANNLIVVFVQILKTLQLCIQLKLLFLCLFKKPSCHSLCELCLPKDQ